MGYRQALLHADEHLEIKRFLEQECSCGGNGNGRAERDIWPTRYLCIVQDFANRGSMEDLTRQQALTLEGLGAVARQVASALAFVHKKKRVHNDVKPANILLHDAGGRGGSGG